MSKRDFFLFENDGSLMTKNKIFLLLAYSSLLLYSSVTSAGFDLILDLDDTVLKGAPIEHKGHPLVQALRYKPGLKYYKHQLSQLQKKSPDPLDPIHYELHEESQETT